MNYLHTFVCVYTVQVWTMAISSKFFAVKWGMKYILCPAVPQSLSGNKEAPLKSVCV